MREYCKRQNEDNLSAGPLQIIRSELLKTNTTEIAKKDITTVRKAMYDKKRKHYLIFPKTLDEAVEQLQSKN